MDILANHPPISASLLHADPESGHLTLFGGRHNESGRLVFPCPDSPGYAPEALPASGVLWSYTVQRFRPKSPPYTGPDAFEPYAVGYIDLGSLIVEARLTGAGLSDWRIGQRMKLVPLPLATGPGGAMRLSYGFAPETDNA